MTFQKTTTAPPRSFNGMARRSVYNLAFPEEGAIELIGHGRIALELRKRVPNELLAKIVAEWNTAADRDGTPAISEQTLQDMLDEAEGVLFLWAADGLSSDAAPVSDAVVEALTGVATSLRLLNGKDGPERQLLRKFLFYIAPDVARALERRLHHAEEHDLLTAAIDTARPSHTPDIGTVTTAMLDALIEDWERRTGKRVTTSTAACSARGFITRVLGLLRDFPPPPSEGPLHAYLVKQAPTLARDLDKPLENAIRRAVKVKSKTRTTT